MRTRRARNAKSIETKIEAAKRRLEKIEIRRDKIASNLKALLDKRDEIRTQEIVDAIGKSKRSYDEILNFINA